VERLFRCRGALLVLAACALAGCSSGPPRAPEIGEAYAGPVTLKLRRELDPHSAEAGIAVHGERLAIIGRRRRFVKVRTASGVEGWTDMRQLLSAAQMVELKQLAESARRLPSQGAATVYDALNVHTEPNRQAPSFYRIKAGEVADVVGHEVSPRVPFEIKGILPPRPKRTPRKRKESASRNVRPPLPTPPQPPPNWLELSQTLEPEPGTEEPEEPPKPTPVDDWTLIRLKDGRAGWVLFRGLRMNIPDEVAQYSEGHRITSYFATDSVNDGGQIKHNYLWTTMAGSREPYEFDSFRYFVWSTRHHRYETAHIERGLKGFYPVRVGPVEAKLGAKTGTFPGFKIIVEENGVRYLKTYAYQVYWVRLVSKQRIETPPENVGQPPPAVAAKTPPPPPPGFFGRLKQSFARLKARWFGKK
jgi:hypothetical protein